MSHELRTPLNAILGFSEIIGGEMFGPNGHPRYVDYAKDIYASGHMLLQIIDDCSTSRGSSTASWSSMPKA